MHYNITIKYVYVHMKAVPLQRLLWQLGKRGFSPADPSEINGFAIPAYSDILKGRVPVEGMQTYKMRRDLGALGKQDVYVFLIPPQAGAYPLGSKVTAIGLVHHMLSPERGTGVMFVQYDQDGNPQNEGGKNLYNSLF